MKKLNKFLILLSMALVCALLNVIVFLTVSDARLNSKVFWLAWGFATPWNLLAATALHLWAGKKDGESILRMPTAYYVCGVFGLLYFILGAIFMYAPVDNITLPLILELVVTISYVIITMYALRVTDYIEKTEETTKKKVFYIRSLQANVDACLPFAKDAETKKALEELSEKIRFSDPMSSNMLSDIEQEIASTVTEIAMRLQNGEEVLTYIQKAGIQIENRNRQCLLLK